LNYAQLLIPDFALILCGYLLCRYTALDRSVWSPIEKLVFYFLFPVLLFSSIVRNPIRLGELSNFIAAGLLTGLCTVILAYVLPYLPRFKNHFSARDHAASAQVAFRFNSFIGLALAERLAGAEGLLLISVLIGICVPLFNVAAVWPMARHGELGFMSELLRNPLILATVSGLTCNLLGFKYPDWLVPTVNRIGGASHTAGFDGSRCGYAICDVGKSQNFGCQLAGHSSCDCTTYRLGFCIIFQTFVGASHYAVDVLSLAYRIYDLRSGYANGV
jgi:malonate transporter